MALSPTLVPTIRLRIRPALLPMQTEFQEGATALQWRYVGQPDSAWQDLVDLADITGPAGADGADGEDGEDGAPGAGSVNSVNGDSGPDITLVASEIPFTPAGTIAATDVQAAIAELDTEKQPLDASLTAYAALVTAADKAVYYTAADTPVTFDLTASGRALLDDANAAAQLTTLGFSAFIQTLIDDANAGAALTTLGISAFVQTLLDDANAAAFMTTLGLTANGQSLVTAANYAAMRALLDLEGGTDFYSIAAADAAFQVKDADLTTIAGLTATTDNFLVSVASAWASRTPAQVRTTLGLVIGTNVQAQGPTLDSLEALSLVAGDVLYATAADTLQRLAKGTALQVLRMNAGATAPEWATNSAGLGSGQLLARYFPLGNEPPSTLYAVFGVRNLHPYLAFDTTTAWAAVWSDRMPDSYAGGGITVTVFYMAASATTGTIGWTVEIERMDASSLDLDADSFAGAQTITAQTVPGTTGQIMSGSVAITSGANMDSLAAGENYRIRIKRDVANDSAAGDAQIVEVHVRET